VSGLVGLGHAHEGHQDDEEESSGGTHFNVKESGLPLKVEGEP
jgi:hypothetical protein